MKNTVIHLSQDCPRTGHVPGRGQDEDKRGQKKFHCPLHQGKNPMYNEIENKIYNFVDMNRKLGNCIIAGLLIHQFLVLCPDKKGDKMNRLLPCDLHIHEKTLLTFTKGDAYR